MALVGAAALAFGGDETLARVAEFVGALAGFGVDSWMTFYGGAERSRAEFLSRTDVEW